MKTINIRELKPYTKNNLLKLLDNSEDTFKKLINYALVDRQDDMYQFKYVGVIIIDKLVINCYPKYFTNYSNDNFKQIIHVIKKYNASNDLDYQNEELEDISFNLLSMMVFFLEDYYEYGIYSKIKLSCIYLKMLQEQNETTSSAVQKQRIMYHTLKSVKHLTKLDLKSLIS